MIMLHPIALIYNNKDEFTRVRYIKFDADINPSWECTSESPYFKDYLSFRFRTLPSQFKVVEYPADAVINKPSVYGFSKGRTYRTVPYTTGVNEIARIREDGTCVTDALQIIGSFEYFLDEKAGYFVRTAPTIPGKLINDIDLLVVDRNGKVREMTLARLQQIGGSLTFGNIQLRNEGRTTQAGYCTVKLGLATTVNVDDPNDRMAVLSKIDDADDRNTAVRPTELTMSINSSDSSGTPVVVPEGIQHLRLSSSTVPARVISCPDKMGSVAIDYYERGGAQYAGLETVISPRECNEFSLSYKSAPIPDLRLPEKIVADTGTRQAKFSLNIMNYAKSEFAQAGYTDLVKNTVILNGAPELSLVNMRSARQTVLSISNAPKLQSVHLTPYAEGIVKRPESLSCEVNIELSRIGATLKTIQVDERCSELKLDLGDLGVSVLEIRVGTVNRLEISCKRRVTILLICNRINQLWLGSCVGTVRTSGIVRQTMFTVGDFNASNQYGMSQYRVPMSSTSMTSEDAGFKFGSSELLGKCKGMTLTPVFIGNGTSRKCMIISAPNAVADDKLLRYQLKYMNHNGDKVSRYSPVLFTMECANDFVDNPVTTVSSGTRPKYGVRKRIVWVDKMNVLDHVFIFFEPTDALNTWLSTSNAILIYATEEDYRNHRPTRAFRVLQVPSQKQLALLTYVAQAYQLEYYERGKPISLL